MNAFSFNIFLRKKKFQFFHSKQNSGYEVQRHQATFILSHTAENESKAGRTSRMVNW